MVGPARASLGIEPPLDETAFRIAVAGNSHVLTLVEGYRLIGAELPASLEVSFIAQGPKKLGYAVGSTGLLEAREAGGGLVDVLGECKATHLFVTWRGSQANIRGLLLTGPRFDVVLPDDGLRAVDPGTELIPCSAAESFILTTLRRDDELSLLIERANQRGARVWLMGPPPPLPDSAVRERLVNEPHFAARLKEVGFSASKVRIVDEAVRVRLYRLLLGVYRKFAAEHGAEFCPPPSSVADRSGLLLPECWGRDITHGSATYGAAYLRNLIAVALASRG